MTAQTIHLGFEVGTGEPVSVPLNHLCVTGQTQMSGKTTTLEALIARSGLKAIAFVTKRGEGAFSGESNSLAPFFREQAGWQFVSQMLGAVLNEKLKFERSWIMKVSRGARCLKDVEDNVNNWINGVGGRKKAYGRDEQVLTTISEYFKLFMPELEGLPYSSQLELRPGLNVIDLSSYSTPLQMLVISAVVEEVYKHQTNIVVVIPEAWEFLPEGKSSPAKASVIALIRKGGNLKNYVWLDSQDIAGVEKEVVRQVGTWILGVQREQNEVARTLKHIPGGVKKPKADDIMQLSKGHFVVCFEKQVKTVYVQPAWMAEGIAHGVAVGDFRLRELPERNQDLERDYRIAMQQREQARELPSLTAESARQSITRLQDGIGHAGNEVWELDTGKLRDIKLQLLAPSEAETYDHDRITNMVARGIAQQDSRPQPVIDQEREEIDRMDNEERQRYVEQISILQEHIGTLQRELAVMTMQQGERAQNEAWPVPPQGPGQSGLDKHRAGLTIANLLLASPSSLEALAKALIPHLPLGRVVIEPREVILKRFEDQEVERILAAAESLSPFMKQAVKLLEAKGSNLNYNQIVRALKGKEASSHSGPQNQQMRADLAELVKAGYLRKDTSGRHFPNLGAQITASLAAYNPKQEDVDNVIGQVLLKLK